MSDSSQTPAIQGDQYFEAQTGVLGSLLLDAPSCAGIVFQRTRPEHYTDACRTIFEAARSLHRESKAIDPVTVKAIVGGDYTSFLLQIMETTPTAANCSSYIDLLLDQAQLSQIQAAGLAMAGAKTPDAARAAVETANRAMVQQVTARTVGAQEGYVDFLARLDRKPDFLPWGLPKLDKAVLSERGDFVVIGGLPSAGKTALSLQFAWAQAEKWRVGYFSLETRPEKIYDRLATLASGVAFGRIRDRTLRREDYDRLAAAGEGFQRRHLDVIHAVGMTVGEIQSITASKRYDVIYIDYLQFVQGEGRDQDLYRRVTQISMDLHKMAGSMGVLVVALSQLSRPPKDGKQARAPGLNSLRESGQIEQDADAVMLLYRQDEELPNSPRVLQIAKNKEGPSGGYLELSFDGTYQVFREMAGESGRQVQREMIDTGVARKQQLRAAGNFEEITGEDRDMPF